MSWLSFCKEESAVEVLVSNEDHNFLIEPNDIRSTHVEVQNIIESLLHIFKKTIL